MTDEKYFQTVIVDDEPLAIEGIRLRLERYDSFKIIHEFTSVSQALKGLKDSDIDIIFLDIQMPRYNGFDFLEQYHYQKDNPPLIVFVTAYDQFALDAFNVHAVDYLLKPIDNKRFREMVNKVTALLRQRKVLIEPEKLEKLISLYEKMKLEGELDKIKIKSLGVYYTISKAEISWVKAEGDYVTIYTSKQSYFVKDTLKNFEEKMNTKYIKRVHRSALVNLKKIAHIVPVSHSDAIIHLKSGEKIKMSRTFKNEILEQISLA